jgi:hypothetical protein
MSAFDAVKKHLDSTVAAAISSGDVYYAAGNYLSAVQAYQLAGQTGATVIGPEIDAAGYSNVTQAYTQQAWQVNSQLASVNAASPVAGDALSASALAQKMLSLYTQAIQAGRAAEASQASSFPWSAVGLVAGIGAVFGLAYGLMHVAHVANNPRIASTQRRTTRREGRSYG